MWHTNITTPPKNRCFICFYEKGTHLNEKMDAYVCDKCIEKTNELCTIDLSIYRVLPNFRASMDMLRKSTQEDFELRNRLLNTLLANKTNRKQLREFAEFGIKTMGQCIGGKPRKFSISNISNDVLGIHKDLLTEPELIKQKILKNQMYKITNLLSDDILDLKDIFS
jgi:hypothetical protein